MTPGAQVRDLRFEVATVHAAQQGSRVSVAAFPDLVMARLELGEHVHGQRWTTQPVVQLLDEAIEEALDLPAWVLLALQSLRAGGNQALVREVSSLAIRACAHAADAHALLYAARRAVLREEEEPLESAPPASPASYEFPVL